MIFDSVSGAATGSEEGKKRKGIYKAGEKNIFHIMYTRGRSRICWWGMKAGILSERLAAT